MKVTNRWNANNYSQNADFVYKLAMPVVDLLQAKKNEKILDLGCGEGSLSLEIQKYDSQVIGVDTSEDMVTKSKEKGIEAYVMSATKLAFSEEFDAVFSNAVLHWIDDAKGVIQQISRVLKPSGRFVGEFGGDGNIQTLLSAIEEVFNRHPEFGAYKSLWFFPTPQKYKELLEENGFSVGYIKLIKRPTPVNDIKEWLEIFANGMMQSVPEESKESFKSEVQDILKEKLYTAKDGWVVDYVRLRFYAKKGTKNG